MASIITGLFRSESQSKKISEDLENALFNTSEYIIYRHEEPISKEEKTWLWQFSLRMIPDLKTKASL